MVDARKKGERRVEAEMKNVDDEKQRMGTGWDEMWLLGSKGWDEV